MVRHCVASFILCCAVAGTAVGQSPFAPPSPAAPAVDLLGGTTSVVVSRNGVPVVQQVAAPRMLDKNVQAAAAFQPLDAVASTDPNRATSDTIDASAVANSVAAGELLAAALTPPKNSPLPGSPLTLLQAIGPFGSNRTAQLAVARAYWKLAAAQGDYNWAVEEADALDLLPSASNAVDQTEMATARASTQARLLEARLGAVTAQQELADLLGIAPTAPLPLAADPPLVGPYRTEFDALFGGRAPPPRMRLIDRTLPIRREAIETHVAAVQAAASAVHAATDARGQGQGDLQKLILCRADLSQQRRAFLAAVRDYNFDIDEYALTAEPNVPVERVIGMLIRIKSAAPPASTAPPTTGQPAIEKPPADNPLMQKATPRTSSPGSAAGTTGAGSWSAPSNPPSTAGSSPFSTTPPINSPASSNSAPPFNTSPPAASPGSSGSAPPFGSPAGSPSTSPGSPSSSSTSPTSGATIVTPKQTIPPAGSPADSSTSPFGTPNSTSPR